MGHYRPKIATCPRCKQRVVCKKNRTLSDHVNSTKQVICDGSKLPIPTEYIQALRPYLFGRRHKRDQSPIGDREW